jgi:phenylacetate-coenzyme A ligase PaaK-like adenylate-forming protein
VFSLTDIQDIAPFSLGRAEKEALYQRALSWLSQHHYDKCSGYQRILDVLGVDPAKVETVQDMPFIPVRLFKEYDLLSIDRSAVVKTMTSSGTSGQRVSKIYLDKDASATQTRILSKIVASFIGKKRLPMLVIDAASTLKDRNTFSARGAGILGFSMFGRDMAYALDDNMQLDIPAVQAFIDAHRGEPILLFGFTFMIWQHFYKPLAEAGIRLDLTNGVMVHGGGWKKLIESAVDNATFKRAICDVSGVARVHNYYGMVEQTGSIFMECESGHLHASIFSDVCIRDHRDFSLLPPGQPGLVQLMSLLPTSYPGHSILSEDLGEIVGEDDCGCGRKGKYFKIHGRIKSAEVRGCGDAYAAGT